jgi:hypothetical protein
VQGRAARALVHALARLPSGRIDAHTTVDIATRAPGSIAGRQMTGWTLIADVRSSGDARAHAVAATLIDRVHEAANLPECECDADVSVQASRSDSHAGPRHATPSGAPTVT